MTSPENPNSPADRSESKVSADRSSATAPAPDLASLMGNAPSAESTGHAENTSAKTQTELTPITDQGPVNPERMRLQQQQRDNIVDYLIGLAGSLEPGSEVARDVLRGLGQLALKIEHKESATYVRPDRKAFDQLAAKLGISDAAKERLIDAVFAHGPKENPVVADERGIGTRQSLAERDRQARIENFLNIGSGTGHLFAGLAAAAGADTGRIKACGQLGDALEGLAMAAGAAAINRPKRADSKSDARGATPKDREERSSEPPSTNRQQAGSGKVEAAARQANDRAVPSGKLPDTSGTHLKVVDGALVGKGTNAQFREDVAAIITRSQPGDGDYKLRFLLGSNGKLFPTTTKGMEHGELFEKPELIEAGHVLSKHADGKLVIIQDAWTNRGRDAATVEHPSRGGHVEQGSAVRIGSFAVDVTTAQAWVLKGLITAQDLAAAPKVNLGSASR